MIKGVLVTMLPVVPEAAQKKEIARVTIGLILSKASHQADRDRSHCNQQMMIVVYYPMRE